MIAGTLFMAFLAVVGILYVILCGPSKTAQELLTRSLKETSAVGFIPDLFLPQERVAAIMSYRDVVVETAEMDTSLVKISPLHKQMPEDASLGDDSGVEFADITGASYRGIMMIVKDPMRLFVGVPDEFGDTGLTLEAMVKKYNASGGVNGGGFHDPEGMGTGGTPEGIVVIDGKLAWGGETTMSTLAGFDGDGVLHVGYMSGKEAMEHNIQWACSYGPVLIVNGEPVNAKLSSGINPRTAIGQREDGAVLLLVIDGRQITSLGATMEDLTEIMLEYGAVNAVNLDGGSSSQMIYKDETMNVNASVRGPRAIPTAFLVR